MRAGDRSRFAVWTTLCLLFAFATQLAAQPAAGDRVRVFIGFRQTPGPAEQALVRAFGGTVDHSYTLVPAVAATVPQAALQGLQQNPQVTLIEPILEVTAFDTVPWGVSHIHADDIHSAGNTGNGIKVCVIDSGIQTTHGDLSGNYVGGYDFVNNDPDPWDDNGHGTHVSGTIAALINSGFGVIGVAPDADILSYKVLNASGSGSFDDVIAAVEACVAAGGKITNNSYGSSGDPGTIVRDAFQNAYNAGVLHIAAAGNSGKPSGFGNTIGYPARYPSVMSVAAVNSSNQRPSWSSYGDELEISAPGVSILSTYLNNGFATLSGTSMASPHVAGVAALVLFSGCATTPAAIRDRLKNTAQDLGSTGWDKYYGYGLVRADLAATCGPVTPVTDLSVISVNAPSPVTQNVGATVDVLVRNTGNQNYAGVRTVQLTDNGVAVGSPVVVNALAPGGQTTLQISWSAPNTGSRTLVAELSGLDDNAGNNSASTTVQVNPPASISLSASGYKIKGVQHVDLTWSGAATTNVDIKRDGALVTTTANDGAYTDVMGRGGGTFTYQVCEAGTSTCSNTATVVF